MADLTKRRKNRLKRIADFLTRRKSQDVTVQIEDSENGDRSGSSGGRRLPNPWEIYGGTDSLPGVDDEFMRFKVETANEQTLRETFKTTVENAKDPVEKERLRHMVGQQNKTGAGLRSHPILAKFKQFFNREISMLPTMDVEQQAKHNELQHRKQYLKDLQKRNENDMSMNPRK